MRPLNSIQLELCHSSTASPCFWQQSPNIFCYDHCNLGFPLVPFPHHCPRPARIFPFCPWLVALHEATVSTPHLLPATRIVPEISFRSVRPISELLQPVPHPPSSVSYLQAFSRVPVWWFFLLTKDCSGVEVKHELMCSDLPMRWGHDSRHCSIPSVISPARHAPSGFLLTLVPSDVTLHHIAATVHCMTSVESWQLSSVFGLSKCHTELTAIAFGAIVRSTYAPCSMDRKSFHSAFTSQQPKWPSSMLTIVVCIPQTTSLSRVSVFNVGGAYQDYQDHGWGSFSEVETMKKKSSILLRPDADSLRHDAIAKDAFTDALEDKELTLRVMERAQISRGIIQDCRKDGTSCEEGLTWGQGRARIWAKGPGNLFQFHCDS